MYVEYFTTDNNEKRICELYWQQNEDGEFTMTVQQLAEKAGRKPSEINSIVNRCSQAYALDTLCITCEQGYPLKNRTEFNNHKPIPSWRCDDCIANEELDKQMDLAARLDAAMAKTPSVNVEDLTIKQACYLLAFLKHSASEDMSRINPVSYNENERLSPSNDYDQSIIISLYREEVTCIDPASNPKAFIGEIDSFRFYHNRVGWLIPITGQYGSLGQLYEALEKQLPTIACQNPLEFNELMLEVSLNECLGYLTICSEQHHFDFSPGNKTVQVFKSCLQDFSVAQIYGLIWRATKDASAYFQRGGIPKKQAANSIVTRIEKTMEQALAEGWVLKDFRRDYTFTQSTISRVIFNNILGTNDGGFSKLLKSLYISEM